MPVLASERSITTRPSPFCPRRKSTSRTACPETAGAASEKRVAVSPPVATFSPPCRVSNNVLPSTLVSYGTDRFKLMTTRVRLPACTILRFRSSPSRSSNAFLPIALVVSAKSRAMRGGVLTEKVPGGFARFCFRVNLTMTLPPGRLCAVMLSIALPPLGAGLAAHTQPMKNSPAPMSIRNKSCSGRRVVDIIFSPIHQSVVKRLRFPSSRPRCPECFLSV